MKFRRFLYIIIAAVIVLAGFDSVESQAAKKRSKAKTTQTVSKKSKSSKKRNSRKYTKRKKRTTRKKSRRVVKAQTPPPEQPSNDSLTLTVNQRLIDWIPSNLNPGGLRVNSVKPDKLSKTARVSLNENFTYLPVTRELIDSLSYHVQAALPDSISDYRVNQ